MKIFDTEISEANSKELSRLLSHIILGEVSFMISKVNTEFLSRVSESTVFKNTLDGFSLNIPDGRGVLWAARYLTLPMTKLPILKLIQAIWQMIYSGIAIVVYPRFITYPISENIPGVEALMLMLNVANETKSGVFFFGATQNDLIRAIEKIENLYPNLKISGSLNGYNWQEDESIDPVKLINNTDAKLLIVALGSPLQEYWIRDNVSKLKNVRVAVGEGGSLAFLAGSLRRAPKWMQKSGLEWLWRLMANHSLTHQTGSRLRRVWNAVPLFIYEVVKWKIKYGTTKAE